MNRKCVKGAEVLKTHECHNDDVNAVSVLPDGKRAISGSDNSTPKICDTESRVAIALYGDVPLYGITVSQDEKTLSLVKHRGKVHFPRMEETGMILET